MNNISIDILKTNCYYNIKAVAADIFLNKTN